MKYLNMALVHPHLDYNVYIFLAYLIINVNNV